MATSKTNRTLIAFCNEQSPTPKDRDKFEYAEEIEEEETLSLIEKELELIKKRLSAIMESERLQPMSLEFQNVRCIEK
ncbi:MAG: hypothetical protein CM15mP83_4260 [Flavobacteriaceae bacterium]|nr:MAG: hypothetical protein CM15mP83_4260 [Flavobacteriaceae bacterium]